MSRRTREEQSVCARCPKVLGQSCCEIFGDEKLATVTNSDVRRISAFAGLEPTAFVEADPLTREEAAMYEARRPLYHGYFATPLVRLTLRQRDGRCVFHTRERGCTLPSDVRPTACLLYPFEKLPDGSWSVQMSRYGGPAQAQGATDACLAVEEATSMRGILKAFGLSKREVEALGERLAQEARAHGEEPPLT